MCLDHQLLTGTPATTPGSCYEKRVLGGSCSQETPATTPTESDTLLNGAASQLSSRNPPTTLSSEFPSSRSNSSAFMSAEFICPPAAERLMTGQPPPPCQPPPPSQPPPPPHPPPPCQSPPPKDHPPQPPPSHQGPSYSNHAQFPPPSGSHPQGPQVSGRRWT